MNKNSVNQRELLIEDLIMKDSHWKRVHLATRQRVFLRNITRKTFVAVDNKKKMVKNLWQSFFMGLKDPSSQQIVPSLFYPFILIALNSVPLLFYFFAIDMAAKGIGGHGRLCAQSVKNAF